MSLQMCFTEPLDSCPYGVVAVQWQTARTMGLQVRKQHLLWGLKSRNRTYFGLVGASGQAVISCQATSAAMNGTGGSQKDHVRGSQEPQSAGQQ